jgi:hypothetical protein
MSDWPPRFKMAEMTPAEAAKFLRNLCEQTVKGSRDWDNMQEIFTQFLTDAYKGGQQSASSGDSDSAQTRAWHDRS